MGPLSGIRVLELAGIGPGPFACMLLADLGAEVVRVDRMAGGMLASQGGATDVLGRGRRSISLDLKKPGGVDTVLDMAEHSDVLIEGFRPGVMEKLGLGPEPCLARNPRLIYGRMTGWGQEGPLSQAAGHDINYIALSGALDAIGSRDGGPVPPLNLLGDFGGGSLYLLMGVLAALLEAQRSGQGQVVDAAIVDGVASLMASTYAFHSTGMWQSERQSNMLDGGAPFYDCYECKDGKWVSIGSIEPQFYQLLAEKLGEDLGDSDLLQRLDKKDWPTQKKKIAALLRTRTRQEWCELMEGSDVCFAPVLSMDEAPGHPHNKARKNFIARGGVVQPAPAPRFSRSTCEAGGTPPAPGADTEAILKELGYGPEHIAELAAAAVIACN